jgi:hypothetical protein
MKSGLVGVVLAAVCGTGCMQSELQVAPGVPLKVERGYCFVRTQFSQGGKQLNRSDTLETLETYDQPKPYAESGESFDVASYVTGIIGSGLVTAGIIGTTDSVDMTETTSTALIASGTVTLVGSIVMCAVAENKYATAVDVYNAQVASEAAPKGSAVGDTSLP